VVGVPVPVLDDATEPFWWDTGHYFFLPAANPTLAAMRRTEPNVAPPRLQRAWPEYQRRNLDLWMVERPPGKPRFVRPL
jgi:hypothetical protein